MRKMSLIVLTALALGLSGRGSIIKAQSDSATLSGTALDSRGSGLSHVVVRISSKATGWKRQTTTDKKGDFILAFVPPGVYSVEAEHEGYSSVTITNIALPVAIHRRLKILLPRAAPESQNGILSSLIPEARPSLMQH